MPPRPEPYRIGFFYLGEAPDALPHKEIPMLNPQTNPWWGTFLVTHGSDSEEEKAFLGYLTSKAIDPGSDPSTLDAAYTDFHAWLTDSYAHDATASEAAVASATPQGIAEARQVELTAYAVPRASHADPVLQKPGQAATRPPELRVEPPAPPTETPATSSESSSPEPRYGTRRRSEGEA